MTFSRRKFSKTVLLASAGAAAGLLTTGRLPGSEPDESMVVLARSRKLMRTGHDLSKEHVIPVLDEALKRITGQTSAQQAWKRLFSPQERVGIKLSCLPGRPLSSSPGLVMSITRGLISAGVKPGNIFIWERTGRELEKAGYQISRKGINVFGTDIMSNGGYSDRIEISRSVGTCFSRIMESVDALISVPVLKDHDIAGVSIGLKNFYGAIYNPNKFHADNCNPYVADLCAHPLISKKLRLTVCDASRMQVHNGPAFFPRYALEYGGILVSTDPVALDYTGWRIIERERKGLKLKSLKAEGREPFYLFSAMKLKLGQARASHIRLIEI
jgi:uncharacterized protein (DUF362 family)